MRGRSFSRRTGEKTGLFSTATLLGRFVTLLAGGALIGLLVFHTLTRYKAVYMLSGMAGIVTLLLILRIQESEKATQRHQNWAEGLQALRSVLSNPGILVTSGAEAAILFACGAFETCMHSCGA
jgi:uncharacterized membrane protein YuzA (DUF378 family)